jgi:hypothetical protein
MVLRDSRRQGSYASEQDAEQPAVDREFVVFRPDGFSTFESRIKCKPNVESARDRTLIIHEAAVIVQQTRHTLSGRLPMSDGDEKERHCDKYTA